MKALNEYFHVLVFLILLLLLLSLQINFVSVGWPIPINYRESGDWSFHILVNFIPGLFILSLCMAPFGYDVERKFSIASILVLTLACGVCCWTLPLNYLAIYDSREHWVIFVLTTMMLNGILQRIQYFIALNIQFPDRKGRREIGSLSHPIDNAGIVITTQRINSLPVCLVKLISSVLNIAEYCIKKPY